MEQSDVCHDALWVVTAYLVKKGKYRFGSLLTAIPAAFMSAVCMTYILTADEGFGISANIAVPVGVCFAAALLVVYVVLWIRSQKHGREQLS